MIATETQAKAKDVSSRVLEAATGLIEWAGKYPDHVQSDPASLLRDVSGLRRRARVIRKACERPASIAIYGESQSGKSNLVSTIARGRNDSVRVQFGANEFDFIEDLDPGGGRESTGLVTRFSAKAAPATRTDLPVYLELLTELDIVTIFSRTFFTGISQKQTDSASESTVQSVLADLKAQRHRGAASHLHGDDVVALRETVNTDYETAGKLTSLNAAFWNDIESLLPDLPLHGRLRFYSLLWLDDPHLSAAAKHLLGILEALGHAQGVLAGIDAIQPRDKSIVDVENLSGFATEMDTSLTVMTVDGQRQTSVGRATLCALTAEIYMQLTAAPGGAMDSCDLLDFPGARNPEPMNSVDEAIAAQKPDDPLDGVAKLYLRGKVDVLFQKYARNQDLAAVVLCRRPDTSNVPGLKHTIYDWISTTLGSSPAARTGVNTLFVVFTLADLVLLPKRGELPPEERLATVIESHFTKYFNNFPSDLWPTQWDRHGPFQNCHWYRNPLVGDSPLFDRKEQSGVLVETGIAPAYAERLETWRRAFLNTDAVARHFVSPDAAWDSLVGPNDGGATHLAQRLAETVNPATKFNLLLERIVEIATELKDRIDEHRVSDDLAVEREKRLAAVREMLGAIADHVVEKGQLGHLLDTFVVDETDLRLIIRKATDDLDGASTRSPSRANSIFGSAGLGGGSASSPSEPQKPDVAVAAETVLTAWVSIFREVTGDPNWQRRLLVEPNHARGLADEFLRIAEHTGLAQRLAERFKSWKTLSGQARLQGLDILVAQIMDDLNNFAFYFGYNDIDPEGRPQLNSKAVHLFDRPTIVEGQFEVGDGDANFNDDLMDSWVLAFWLRANEAIQAEGPPDVDPEAQRELQRHSAHLAIG